MNHRFFSCAALVALLVAGCTKIGQIPPTIPLTAIQNLEQTPFKTEINTINLLGPSVLSITAEHVPGQAVIGYSFRSSVPGAVTSLGLLLPSTGYEHVVTLWDSTGLVLAQAEVPSLDSGHWTYVNLAIVNQEVIIQPYQTYIVGFNTLAVGVRVDIESPGNWVYLLSGLNGVSPISGPEPGIMPFTSGAITYLNYYVDFYDGIYLQQPFPGSSESNPYGQNSVLGVCDIGFIPAP
jgi:hypothetical protein